MFQKQTITPPNRNNDPRTARTIRPVRSRFGARNFRMANSDPVPARMQLAMDAR
jgi:hypothetical protein